MVDGVLIVDGKDQIGHIAIVDAIAQGGDFKRLEGKGRWLGAGESLTVGAAFDPQVGHAGAGRGKGIRAKAAIAGLAVVVGAIVEEGEWVAKAFTVGFGKPAFQRVARDGAAHAQVKALGASGEAAIAAAFGDERAGADAAKHKGAVATWPRGDNRVPQAVATVGLHLHILHQPQIQTEDIGAIGAGNLAVVRCAHHQRVELAAKASEQKTDAVHQAIDRHGEGFARLGRRRQELVAHAIGRRRGVIPADLDCAAAGTIFQPDGGDARFVGQ